MSVACNAAPSPVPAKYNGAQVRYAYIKPITAPRNVAGMTAPRNVAGSTTSLRSPRVGHSVGPSRYSGASSPASPVPSLVPSPTQSGSAFCWKSASPYKLSPLPNSGSAVSLNAPVLLPKTQKVPLTPQKMPFQPKKVPVTPEKVSQLAVPTPVHVATLESMKAVGVKKWSSPQSSLDATLDSIKTEILVSDGIQTPVQVLVSPNVVSDVTASDTTSETLNIAPEADSGMNTEVEVEPCLAKDDLVVEVIDTTPAKPDMVLPAAPVSTMPAPATRKSQCFAGCSKWLRK